MTSARVLLHFLQSRSALWQAHRYNRLFLYDVATAELTHVQTHGANLRSNDPPSEAKLVPFGSHYGKTSDLTIVHQEDGTWAYGFVCPWNMDLTTTETMGLLPARMVLLNVLQTPEVSLFINPEICMQLRTLFHAFFYALRANGCERYANVGSFVAALAAFVKNKVTDQEYLETVTGDTTYRSRDSYVQFLENIKQPISRKFGCSTDVQMIAYMMSVGFTNGGACFYSGVTRGSVFIYDMDTGCETKYRGRSMITHFEEPANRVQMYGQVYGSVSVGCGSMSRFGCGSNDIGLLFRKGEQWLPGFNISPH